MTTTITKLLPNQIFVFGSNLAGRHGAGAARMARDRFGAIRGQGVGLQGSSYAIPTKDGQLASLPLHSILMYVLDFLAFARDHKDLEFLVTRIGCGLAGYKDEEIAWMFKQAPDNCKMPEEWLPFLTKNESSQSQ